MLLTLNGRRTDPAQATVSVFDRGFLFGDAIYEVITTVAGRRPFHLGAHLERLARSGDAIGLDVRGMRADLDREIAELIADAPGEDELTIRIMITRGAAPDVGLDTVVGPPVRIVLVKPIVAFPPAPLRLISVAPDDVVGRVSPGVKSNNRQSNVMAHLLARERGRDDGLFVDPSGCVTEGPTWNVFCVRGGRVVTPPLERGILAGITRQLVFDLAGELGLPAEERAIPLEEARAADEVFVTSTTRGVKPVAELDDAEFPAPGPVTTRLADALRARMARGA